MSAKELISIKGILKLFPCCDVDINQIVTCPESSVVKLNLVYVVVARANWKSGESASINKERWDSLCVMIDCSADRGCGENYEHRAGER